MEPSPDIIERSVQISVSAKWLAGENFYICIELVDVCHFLPEDAITALLKNKLFIPRVMHASHDSDVGSRQQEIVRCVIPKCCRNIIITFLSSLLIIIYIIIPEAREITARRPGGGERERLGMSNIGHWVTGIALIKARDTCGVVIGFRSRSVHRDLTLPPPCFRPVSIFKTLFHTERAELPNNLSYPDEKADTQPEWIRGNLFISTGAVRSYFVTTSSTIKEVVAERRDVEAQRSWKKGRILFFPRDSIWAAID
ncbi:hypothetical protein GEV33_007856 [Tenebrio molitor]|uniref:Uncharacterized protein n=1 Tax=Tenebrio molitor TaxID=7067 RepID=A0A8J6HHL5_TENMO|nr:hypothetical protein GEV33_007856 [Tenebrio molitor]